MVMLLTPLASIIKKLLHNSNLKSNCHGIFLFVINDIFCMSNDKNFFALRPNYFGLRPILRDFLA